MVAKLTELKEKRDRAQNLLLQECSYKTHNCDVQSMKWAVGFAALVTLATAWCAFRTKPGHAIRRLL